MTVKPAHEVVAGDWINWRGTAHRVTLTYVRSMEVDVGIVLEGGRTLEYRPDELVEVMDK